MDKKKLQKALNSLNLHESKIFTMIYRNNYW